MESEQPTRQEPEENYLIKEHRIGTFRVSRDLIRWSDPEKILKFMSNFLIVRAEMFFAYDSIEYTAYSPLFNPARIETQPPDYLIRLSTQEDGSIDLAVDNCLSYPEGAVALPEAK